MACPVVTVVIPCWNAAHYLPESVGSVVEQTLSPIEVVIVDDGSPDDVRDVAAALIDRHPDRDIRLVSRENGGLAAARNTGIRAGSAPYVCCLDADDRLSPRYLEECVRTLERTPGASIAYGTQQNFGEDATVWHPQPYDFLRLRRENYLQVCAVFRRRAWEDTGGYDDAKSGYEDWDFWVKCGVHGHPATPAPAALWHYRISAGSLLQRDLPRDPLLKAEIVLNHPTAFAAGQRAWAQRVAAGDETAWAEAGPAGKMPAFPPATVRETGVRAGELLARPRVCAFVLPSAGASVAGALDAAGIRVVETAGPAELEAAALESDAEWLLACSGARPPRSPWPDLSLGEALDFVESVGFDAVQSNEGSSIWRNPGAPVAVDATGEGRIDVRFVGRRVFPLPFADDAETSGRILRDLFVALAIRKLDLPATPWDDAASAAWLARACDRPEEPSQLEIEEAAGVVLGIVRGDRPAAPDGHGAVRAVARLIGSEFTMRGERGLAHEAARILAGDAC